jgi:hypothetical protein
MSAPALNRREILDRIRTRPAFLEAQGLGLALKPTFSPPR